MTGNVTINHTHECDESTTNQEFEVEVRFEATGGSSGCTYGPPEMCETPEPPDIEYTGYTLLSYCRKDARKDSGNPVVEEWDGEDKVSGDRHLVQFVTLLAKSDALDDRVRDKCIEAAAEYDDYPD